MRFAALTVFNTIVGEVERMPNSNSKRPTLARAAAITASAIAMLLVGNVANARPWKYRPTISGSPPTTDIAGTAYNFIPTASGPSGYTLTFSISGKPSWATFNKATGQLAGTPTSANVGSFPNILISVSDGLAKSSLSAFTITVTAPAAPSPPPNTAPTISGTASTTATVGTAYNFTPSAGDTDGDPLSFSVQNKPAWATFSIATGALSGTPATTDVGTDSSIVISVSDGYTTAALAPFSINVSQPVATSGSATLSWTAPTMNSDGSALTDLAGYHVYYGTSPSAMSTVVNLGSASTTTYTLNSLASGTWYFSVTSYTTSGLESALSNTVSKVIP